MTSIIAVPGQFVALKPLQDATVKSSDEQWTFFPLASSPYAVHRESADLDASIIEVNAVRASIPLSIHLYTREEISFLHKRRNGSFLRLVKMRDTYGSWVQIAGILLKSRLSFYRFLDLASSLNEAKKLSHLQESNTSALIETVIT